MKKVTIRYPHNGRRITQFVTEIIDELDNDKTAYANMFNGLKTMTENGDIWFRNYEHEGENINCVFILDSETSVSDFAPHRAYLESATGYIDTIVEDITFDEFASFAAERNETYVEHARKTELDPGYENGQIVSGSVL